METSDKTIKIVKILNLPVENNQTKEVAVDIDITEDKHSYRQVEPDLETFVCRIDAIDKLCDSGIIKYNTPYKIKALLAEDKQGNKYTLYDFSYKYMLSIGFRYFDFCYNMILFGKHIIDLDKKQFNKIDVEATLKKEFNFNINHTKDGLRINSKISPDIEEFINAFAEDKNNFPLDEITLQITGCFNFNRAKEEIYRLSEYVFLIYEELFCYDTFTIYSDNEQYKFIMPTKPKERKRKWRLYTDMEIQNKLVSNPTTISVNEDEFNKFLQFRKDSHFIFDLFKRTVYSDTFTEDYPLRLSQIIDGLTNFLGIAKNDAEKYKKEDGKPSWFEIAVSSALSKVEDKYQPFKNENQSFDENKKKDFCDKIKKHRNSFSHAIAKGNYLQREENYEYAKILYTTIRILIIKHIRGQL